MAKPDVVSRTRSQHNGIVKLSTCSNIVIGRSCFFAKKLFLLIISLLIVVLEGKCVSVVNLRLVKKHVGEFSCIIPLSDHHLVKLDQLC